MISIIVVFTARLPVSAGLRSKSNTHGKQRCMQDTPTIIRHPWRSYRIQVTRRSSLGRHPNGHTGHSRSHTGHPSGHTGHPQRSYRTLPCDHTTTRHPRRRSHSAPWRQPGPGGPPAATVRPGSGSTLHLAAAGHRLTRAAGGDGASPAINSTRNSGPAPARRP